MAVPSTTLDTFSCTLDTLVAGLLCGALRAGSFLGAVSGAREEVGAQGSARPASDWALHWTRADMKKKCLCVPQAEIEG